jgi:hypothetical protein
LASASITIEVDPLGLAALAHRQLVHLVEPPHALVVHLVALSREQIADAPVAEAPARMRQLDDPGAEFLGRDADARQFAKAGPGQPRIAAGAAFADVEHFDHLACRLAPGLRG